MKWVHIAEKAYRKSKRKKDWPTTLICPKFYSFTVYDSYVFSYEFNKGLECSTSPIETIYHLLIWAMREPPIYYLCLLSSFFFSSFFFFLFMPCNFFPWCPLRNFDHAHGLCPYLLPKPPFPVFNLVGFFLLLFFFSNVASLESIHVDWVKYLFPIQICNSCITSWHDLLDNKRNRPSWLHLSSQVKIFIFKHF